MILLLLLMLLSFVKFTYCSQESLRDQRLIQSFIPSASLDSYQNINFYGSINNDSITSQNSSIQTLSVFQYPEDFDPQYYVQDKNYSRSKKEIYCCICSGISSSTVLAFIGYLIFH